MNLLPKASGNRPRLACEIAAGGVVAARSPEPGAPLSAVSLAALREGAIVPGLKPGNIADRVAAIAALRGALEAVGIRANARNGELTLVIPDAAVRVLLLDFDALPNKLSETLPIVRFRLKKLVPFDADEAMVSFQIMSSSRSVVRVLAVAIPRDVLSEYESVAREAGFEPGAVLPSTLAALAALTDGEGASLVVNAHMTGATTAIVRSGILLLHRTVELAEHAAASAAALPASLFEPSTSANGGSDALPVVSREETAGEWAAQQPLSEYGRNPYADRVSTEAAIEDQDGITGMGVPPVLMTDGHEFSNQQQTPTSRFTVDLYANEAAPVSRSPYASPLVTADLNAELHNTVMLAPPAMGSLSSLADPTAANSGRSLHPVTPDESPEPPVHVLAPEAQAEEIARAISVAVAYFEDSLGAPPEVLLSAGPLGAEGLQRTLREQGVAQENGLRARELVDAASVVPSAVSNSVPRGWLAGVVGALKS